MGFKGSSFFFTILVCLLPACSSVADPSAKDTQKVISSNFVETTPKSIRLSGYVDAGYSYNFNGSVNPLVAGRFSGDEATGGDFNLYAVKLALEKPLTNENSAQAGFRADVMIGEDAYYLQTRNRDSDSSNFQQNSSSLFLEQAYASFRAPVGNGWDFKVGKFVSILGYEVIERPANLNITYGILWQMFPLYYTGVVSSYRFDEYLDGKLGVVNGSNSDNNTTTGQMGDGCALIAALNLTSPGSNAVWSNNFQYSTNEDNNTATGGNLSSLPVDTQDAGNYSTLTDTADNTGSGHLLIYNSWGSWAPRFAEDKLLFAFNSVLGTATTSPNSIWNAYDPAGPYGAGAYGYSTTWWGAGAYLKYQFNDWFSLASRAEYFGGSNDSRFALRGNFSPGPSLWEYTVTGAFQVVDNLLIRAEYRMDWGNQSAGARGTHPPLPGSTLGGYECESNGPSFYAGAEVVYSF